MRQGVGLRKGGGWWRHLVRKGRVWEEQAPWGDKFPPWNEFEFMSPSKWMPLRGSCTNGLKAYEQGQAGSRNL